MAIGATALLGLVLLTYMLSSSLSLPMRRALSSSLTVTRLRSYHAYSALCVARKDDIIDAEIVREENLPDRRNNDDKSKKNSNDNENNNNPSPSSIGSGLAGIFSSVSNTISRAFGGKESEDDRRKKLMNNQIDKMVKETGIGGFAGMMVGGIIKKVGAMLAQQIKESASDYEKVCGSVISALNNDEQATRMLGDGAALANPVSSSSSSFTVNGVSTKQMQYIIPLQSHAGSYVQVTASTSNSRVSVERLILQHNGGTYFIKTGSGGGSGGQRTVIDV